MEKKQILVLDDQAHNRNFMESFLKILGYEITLAEDGLDGLGKAKMGEFDLVFSDIEMPNMNGLEFLGAYKKTEKGKNTTVIMLSSLGDEATIKRALGLGARSYVQKPLTNGKITKLFAEIGWKI